MSAGEPATSRTRSTWARRAGADRADTTSGRAVVVGSGSSGATGAGNSSTIRCTLVPLTPNDDTPARRGRPPVSHDRASASNSTAPDDQSTCDDGSSTCNVRGNTPRRIAITILITPATPAAD